MPRRTRRPGATLTYVQGLKNYRKAIEDGLLKIMSKMGISVLASYQGAQIFEAIGVGPAVIERCFAGTSSQVGGIGFAEIARESLARHGSAYGEAVPAPQEGSAATGRPGLLPVPARGRGACRHAAGHQELPFVRPLRETGGIPNLRRGVAGEPAAGPARSHRVRRARGGPHRYRGSRVRSRKSGGASPRPACRWGRSRPRRTSAWPSP